MSNNNNNRTVSEYHHIPARPQVARHFSPRLQGHVPFGGFFLFHQTELMSGHSLTSRDEERVSSNAWSQKYVLV